jgi:hypothetical protein
MPAKKPTNLAASVRQRLYNLARAGGEELQLILTRYGVERLLYRLSHTPGGERFVLKGAVLFYAWEGAPHRPTRDVDFAVSGDPSPGAITGLFRAVCEAEVEPDGLSFLTDTVSLHAIRDLQEYGGVRVNLTATLGAARIPLQVDIGFGDAITPGPRLETIPTLLDFPAPTIWSYPPETVIAEKFEAMVSLGMANSRLKDYFDVWQLARSQEFEGLTLAKAIEVTFRRRGTPIPTQPPLALTEVFGTDIEKQAQWRRFLTRGHISDPPGNLVDVVKRLAGFLLSPASAAAASESFEARWVPATGWSFRPE